MKLLIICGPTATGKTQLAVQLAKRFHGELVSADSRQVYKGMDIVTGKDLPVNISAKGRSSFGRKYQINKKQYQLPVYDIDGIPIWMYDVVRPDEDFSIFHYQKLARAVITDIHKRGKLPIVVGGTGLYIKSLFDHLDTMSIPPHGALRKQLEKKNLSHLQKRLQREDVATWETLNDSERANKRRLIRKIEIALWKREHRKTPEEREATHTYDSLIIGLTASYPTLYKRIDQRVDTRIQEGAIDEIRELVRGGYSWDLPSMSSIGYRRWREQFSSSSLTHSSSLITQKWKFAEHGYARRQLAWFRKQEGVHWFSLEKGDVYRQVEELAAAWYT